MKLCSFGVKTPLGLIERVGVYTEQGVVDATAARQAWLERRMPLAAAQRVGAAQVPSEMIALIGSGQLTLDWLQEALDALFAHGVSATSAGVRTI